LAKLNEDIANGLTNPEELGKYRALERNFMVAQQKIGDVLTIVQSIPIKKEDKDRIMNCLCEV
jgi:hypothetical protein